MWQAYRGYSSSAIPSRWATRYRTKFIWATTTPIPDGELNPPRKIGQVAQYNAIAAKVMKEHNIAINDLHARVAPRFGELQTPKDLHYKAAGYEFLAQQVAAEILKAIGN